MHLRRVILLSALLTIRAASGLTIVDYAPATHDRFVSGYPGTPVANTSASFLGNGYDLSGVGWNPSLTTQSFAMISDQYFVYSNHYAPGATIDFRSPTLGTVVSYGVSATTYQFTFNGEVSDFAIGKLDAALDPSHGITSYAILDLSLPSDYMGLTALIYGHGPNGPRLGANTVDLLTPYTFPGGTTTNSYGIGYSFNPALSGDSMFDPGDSSSPTFIPWYGTLALVGTHSVTGTIDPDPTEYSVDNLIAAYTDQMTTQGIAFTSVPEPSRWLLLLAGACAMQCRRHRAPRE